MIRRDTNLFSRSDIPRGFLLVWYEPIVLKMIRRIREELADYNEGVARRLGLEGFESAHRSSRPPRGCFF